MKLIVSLFSLVKIASGEGHMSDAIIASSGGYVIDLIIHIDMIWIIETA